MHCVTLLARLCYVIFFFYFGIIIIIIIITKLLTLSKEVEEKEVARDNLCAFSFVKIKSINYL